MNKNINPNHGFRMLRDAQELKLNFDQAGPEGLLSFVKACIWSGIDESEEIVEEAVAISGSQMAELATAAIEKGESRYWERRADGRLELLIK